MMIEGKILTNAAKYQLQDGHEALMLQTKRHNSRSNTDVLTPSKCRIALSVSSAMSAVLLSRGTSDVSILSWDEQADRPMLSNHVLVRSSQFGTTNTSTVLGTPELL
jgi:hypothetical protein